MLQQNTDATEAATAWTFVNLYATAKAHVTGVDLSKPIAYRLAAFGTAGFGTFSDVFYSPEW